MTEQLPGGYTGRILRVDLTTERVWVETTDRGGVPLLPGRGGHRIQDPLGGGAP